jgi:hypothetical protein
LIANPSAKKLDVDDIQTSDCRGTKVKQRGGDFMPTAANTT